MLRDVFRGWLMEREGALQAWVLNLTAASTRLLGHEARVRCMLVRRAPSKHLSKAAAWSHMHAS
jgi:hypothetical protein